MRQPDMQNLANHFVKNAIRIKVGNKVMIEYCGSDAHKWANVLAAEIRKKGGCPYLVDASAETIKKLDVKDSAKIDAWKQNLLNLIEQADASVRIRDDNDLEQLSHEERKIYLEAYGAVGKERIKKEKWLVFDAPTESLAKNCGISPQEFDNFFKKACMFGGEQIEKTAEPLRKLLNDGKEVRLISKEQETDLTFRINDIPSVSCCGTHNIPDGECFTAPFRESVNGVIKFKNCSYNGKRFEFIKLEFQNGKVVNAKAENEQQTEALDSLLNTDDGVRYIGEFAISFNPLLKEPTGSALFDEKIDGAFHIALGNHLPPTNNGNKSAIHWDLVQIQRPENGGGEIYIDGKLIRKDGKFTTPELEPLNPEKLLKTLAEKGRGDDRLYCFCQKQSLHAKNAID